MIRILVVDDSALVRKLFGQVFAAEADFEVEVARDGLEALSLVATFQPDVITLDIHMPQMDGLTFLDRLMVERPCPVVMVSSLTEDGAEETLEALRLGAVDFVAKPTGAVSLRMDDLAPELVAKVRAAAGAKLRSSLRLKDRVRHRIGGPTPPGRGRSSARVPLGSAIPVAATGEGLVLIGTSTGGPPALEQVLAGLPAGFRWPVLVAQHMPASFTGALARRLDALCAIRVVEVTRSTLLEPGCAYIGRGDADLIVARRPAGLTALAAPPLDYPWHPSVDRLVRTTMEHVAASQIIGVLMTGMGDDGAAAMADLHALGGRTVAESEESAVVWGMPGELVKLSGAGDVLPVQKIAAHLSQMVA